jgi:predicted Zn-dependent protease
MQPINAPLAIPLSEKITRKEKTASARAAEYGEAAIGICRQIGNEGFQPRAFDYCLTALRSSRLEKLRSDAVSTALELTKRVSAGTSDQMADILITHEAAPQAAEFLTNVYHNRDRVALALLYGKAAAAQKQWKFEEARANLLEYLTSAKNVKPYCVNGAFNTTHSIADLWTVKDRESLTYKLARTGALAKAIALSTAWDLDLDPELLAFTTLSFQAANGKIREALALIEKHQNLCSPYDIKALILGLVDANRKDDARVLLRGTFRNCKEVLPYKLHLFQTYAELWFEVGDPQCGRQFLELEIQHLREEKCVNESLREKFTSDQVYYYSDMAAIAATNDAHDIANKAWERAAANITARKGALADVFIQSLLQADELESAGQWANYLTTTSDHCKYWAQRGAALHRAERFSEADLAFRRALEEFERLPRSGPFNEKDNHHEGCEVVWQLGTCFSPAANAALRRKRN